MRHLSYWQEDPLAQLAAPDRESQGTICSQTTPFKAGQFRPNRFCVKPSELQPEFKDKFGKSKCNSAFSTDQDAADLTSLQHPQEWHLKKNGRCNHWKQARTKRYFSKLNSLSHKSKPWSGLSRGRSWMRTEHNRNRSSSSNCVIYKLTQIDSRKSCTLYEKYEIERNLYATQQI